MITIQYNQVPLDDYFLMLHQKEKTAAFRDGYF
jgi:hypothetical protein